MIPVMQHIRRSLSLQLSLSILAFVLLIFFVTMGFLFIRSREAVRKAAIDETSQILNNTALHLQCILDEVEVATNNSDWQVAYNMQPDSLLALSARIVKQNPVLNGCSISFEPYYFKDQGKYFSAYSSNNDGHIETEQEGSDEYDYFKMMWYTEPLKQQKACWVDPFRDYNPTGQYDRDMIASFCKPLFTVDGTAIGVISADLSQRKLSQILAQEWIYPNSFYMLLGTKGDVIATSKEDATTEDLEDSKLLVLRQSLQSAAWTLVIACPKSDTFKGYYHLIYLIVSILGFGLILLLAVCYFIVHRTVSPVRQLAKQAGIIAEGHFDLQIKPSSRPDEVGRLQNSFATMLQTITKYVNDLQQMKNATEQRNEELQVAKSMAEESDRKTTAFIQDLFHQIRTPLNVISGFVQVLRDTYDLLEEDEMNTVTHDIQQYSLTISNIIDNLVKTQALEGVTNVDRLDRVECSRICQLAAEALVLRKPDDIELYMETSLEDEFYMTTNKDFLMKILGELLFNANKFTSRGSITVGCCQNDSQTVSFYVNDSGPGIAEADSERIFMQFTKLSDFNEGLGLGLSLCRRMAELLGGTLVLDSTYTYGARFVLTLPLK